MMMDDEAEFRAFVTSRWASLVRTAFLVTTDRGIAEDCVQDAMVRVHRNWRRIRRDSAAPAYAHRAVLNAALSWRRRRRIREVPLADWAGPEPGWGSGPGCVSSPGSGSGGGSGEPGPAGLDGVDPVLLSALRSLPPLMRAAVALRYLEDRSEVETAHLLGCSVGTVKSSASRGVARLRAALTTGADAPADPVVPPHPIDPPQSSRPSTAGPGSHRPLPAPAANGDAS